MTRQQQRPMQLLIMSTNVFQSLGIRTRLEGEPGFTIVGDVKTPGALIAAIKREHPDVMILDIDDYDRQGLDLIRDSLCLSPRIHIVLLSGLGTKQLIEQALNLGVAGVILKSQTTDVLLEKLRRLSEEMGQPALYESQPALSDKASAASSSMEQAAHQRISTLTMREREIIDYLGKGLTNKEIAMRLNISSITVRHHLTSIFTKLNVMNRQKLLLFAHTYQLVTRPSITEAINRSD